MSDPCRDACYRMYEACHDACGSITSVPAPFDDYMTIPRYQAAICYPACATELAACYAACASAAADESWFEALEALAESILGGLSALGESILGGIEAVGEAFVAAMEWMADHPEVVIGTVLVVGAIAFVVVTGGSGAPALVLVAA